MILTDIIKNICKYIAIIDGILLKRINYITNYIYLLIVIGFQTVLKIPDDGFLSQAMRINLFITGLCLSLRTGAL